MTAAKLAGAFAIAFLALLPGCATLVDVPRVASYACSDWSQTTLGRAFLRAYIPEFSETSGFHLYDKGLEAFLARAALAEAAERTLDLQYYIVDRGLTTDLLLRSLVRAAQRGVRVRILLDDVHEPNRTFAFEAVAAHHGIEVRLFNPFVIAGGSSLGRLLEFIADGERLNRRMHNKLWIADNAAGLIGGRNLADEYFDAHASANFSDVDLLAVGPVVRQLSEGFDEYWNSASAVPFVAFLDTMPGPEDLLRVKAALDARLTDAGDTEYGRPLAADDVLRSLKQGELPLIWARAQAVYDEPDKPSTAITRGMQHVIPQIRAIPSATVSELVIISPYFIPSEEGRVHLGEMRQRGVRVAVLTNSLASTDALAAHAGYARHRADLLRRGVELFELRPEPGAPHLLKHRWRRSSASGLHAKIIVVDRVRVFVGSMNLDPRSRLHNTESWVGIESSELASKLLELFDESTRPDHSFRVVLRDSESGDELTWITEEKGRQVRYEQEPLTGLGARFWRSLLSISIPEHML